jgi:raffinose/stachyose/melibiose transport system permease protein
MSPKSRNITPYLFLSPALFMYLIFVIYPLFATIYLGFFKWDGASPTMQFVGLDNYITMFLTDRVFWIAAVNNLIWIVLSIAVPATLGLVLASVLAQPAIRGKTVFRVIYFLPICFSMVAKGVMWSMIYNPRWGALNTLLTMLGLKSLTRVWLGDESIALYAVLQSHWWLWFGYCFIIFYAGLQEIPPELYDSAKVDGANIIQRFIHVTVPSLRNVSTFVYLWTLMGALKVFELVLVMTKGGPGYSTYTIAYRVYEVTVGSPQFAGNLVGYGAAMATVLGILVLALSLLFIRFREKGE